ncbi:hypothetical protein OAI64_02640 [Schleiferiaceae bacterium]|jgi:hypothetical protein|nr:hypothetical protein [Schleiferiaceae bacterium]
MKKIQIPIAIALLSFSLNAQQKKEEPVFDNWFAKKPTAPPPATPPPPPNVPLDGGLVALIAAGGAVGYKKYKDRKKTE